MKEKRDLREKEGMIGKQGKIMWEKIRDKGVQAEEGQGARGKDKRERKRKENEEGKQMSERKIK